MGTFTRDQDGPSLGGSQGCSKGGWRCPADCTPEGLVVEDGASRHPCECQSHRYGTALGDENIMRFEELLPARIQVLSSDFRILSEPLIFSTIPSGTSPAREHTEYALEDPAFR